MVSRSRLGEVLVERTRQEWLSPAKEGETEEDFWGYTEKIFGIRLRIQDGTVEFYRQEDIRQRQQEDIRQRR